MKRKGFTLVELLIVIVVIGILSAMMMLSSTEAVSSARASNIVSNLRNFKTAALAMYVDNLDKASDTSAFGKYTNEAPTDGKISMYTVVQYMNNANTSSGGSTSDSTLTNYGIVNIANDGWFVYYDFGTTAPDTRVKEKLAGRAKSVGLYGAAAAANFKKDENNVFTNEQFAGMWVVKP